MGKIIGLVVYLIMLLLLIFGWVMNLVTLIQGGYENLVTTAVGIIGVLVVPVGAIVHYVAG